VPVQGVSVSVRSPERFDGQIPRAGAHARFARGRWRRMTWILRSPRQIPRAGARARFARGRGEARPALPAKGEREGSPLTGFEKRSPQHAVAQQGGRATGWQWGHALAHGPPHEVFCPRTQSP